MPLDRGLRIINSRIINKFLSLIILFFLFPAAGTGREIKLSFTGDIIIHDSMISPVVKKLFRFSQTNRFIYAYFKSFFTDIHTEFSRSQMVIGNMEFPLYPPFISSGNLFNCRPEIVPALKAAGFTQVSIANNHILDHAIPGLISTAYYLNKYNLKYTGAGKTSSNQLEGDIQKVGDYTIGIISCTGVLNRKMPPGGNNLSINWLYSRMKISDAVSRLRSRSDIVIMLVHGGREYSTLPEKEFKKILRYYTLSGVDIIIGNHPHVLQPAEKVERLDGTYSYIFYSLGNFISGKCKKMKEIKISTGKLINRSILLNVFLTKGRNCIKKKFEAVPISTYIQSDTTNHTQYRVISLSAHLRALYRMKKSSVLNKRQLSNDITILQKEIRKIDKIINKYYPELIKIKYH